VIGTWCPTSAQTAHASSPHRLTAAVTDRAISIIIGGYPVCSLTGIEHDIGLSALYNVLLIVMAVVAVAGVALMIRARLPLPLTLFGILVIVAAVVSSAPSIKPRLIWTAFPIFIGAAAKLPRWLYWPVLIVSATALAFLTGWWPNHYIGPAP
jgi:hypothetical protein